MSTPPRIPHGCSSACNSLGTQLQQTPLLSNCNLCTFHPPLVPPNVIELLIINEAGRDLRLFRNSSAYFQSDIRPEASGTIWLYRTNSSMKFKHNVFTAAVVSVLLSGMTVFVITNKSCCGFVWWLGGCGAAAQRKRRIVLLQVSSYPLRQACW